MPHLVLPDLRYQSSFLEALRESESAHVVSEIAGDFPEYLESLRRLSCADELPLGWVPATEYWLVDGGEYLGRVDILHTLTPRLREYGGQIGYDVRPSRRGRGYGHLILRLALVEARRLGFSKLLLICDAHNLPSRRVIEGNGGVLESEYQLSYHHAPVCRYWIQL